MRSVLVDCADGFDEVGVAYQRSVRVEGLLKAELCEGAEVRHIVLVGDGVDMDEVGGGRTGRGVGVLAECEVVEVVDQSGEDRGIIRGEVESSRVCFLRNEGKFFILFVTSKALLFAKDTYLELATEELAEVLRLDPENGLVDLPLLVATCDGEIGE